MSRSKPFYLTVRCFVDGQYDEGGRANYIRHPLYSKRPSNYTRSFMLLQKDLLDLFNYIEPSDANLKTYSFRIQELLIRTCIEIEANFKAIFSLNKYTRFQKGANLNLKDYYLINSSHFLSKYTVKLPYWSENLMTANRKPFEAWDNPPNADNPWVLEWYQAYSKTKHDKANSLHLANFENLIDAFCALVALLTSQYLFEDFTPSPDLLAVNSGWQDGYESAIGDYFRVIIPRQLPENEFYDFNWQELSMNSHPFEKFDYDSLKSV